MLLEAPKREILESAIKSQKWDRGSYEYALNAMQPNRIFSDSSIYKKSELIEMFHEMAPKYWTRISNFTTFRNL
jgi:hypothetical protein